MPSDRAAPAGVTVRNESWTRERWESLAQDDPEFYIWTDVARGDDFVASGERDAARIWARVEPHLGARGTVLEIGCGIGRVLLPMAHRFQRAVGVDIAPTMLRGLEQRAAARNLPHVTGVLADEPWERLGAVDLAYSHIVLQHIESWQVITDYFRRIAACLAPSGVCYAQFDTRPRTVLYHLKNRLPERLLPRNWQRGVRRIRRSPEQVREMVRGVGLTIVSETGAGTEDMVLLLTVSPSGG